MTIGERIRNRRKELGLSQEELANRLGNKSRASVCTVEKDRGDMTTEQIKKYAEALETTPAYLMGMTEFINDYIIHRNERDKIFLEIMNKIPDSKTMEIIKLYSSASPEVRSAVDLLLKSDRLNHESHEKP